MRVLAVAGVCFLFFLLFFLFLFQLKWLNFNRTDLSLDWAFNDKYTFSLLYISRVIFSLLVFRWRLQVDFLFFYFFFLLHCLRRVLTIRGGELVGKRKILLKGGFIGEIGKRRKVGEFVEGVPGVVFGEELRKLVRKFFIHGS